MRSADPNIQSAAIAKGETFAEVAAAIGMNPHTFHKKVQGKRDWRPEELKRLQAYLGLEGGTYSGSKCEA